MTATTHRELLEGAARACGHTFKWVTYNGVDTLYVLHTKEPKGDWQEWNSLHSMADCFEMETALRIEVHWYEDRVHVFNRGQPVTAALFEEHNNDRKAARMYASTRCAFEISKG